MWLPMLEHWSKAAKNSSADATFRLDSHWTFMRAVMGVKLLRQLLLTYGLV